jgi:hypothetical protein
MTTTYELFERALEKQRAAAWARQFNLDRSAFSHVKKQRRLSPVLAGNFAIEMGEDPEHWMAVAAIEAAEQSELLERLKRLVGGSGKVR